MRRRTAWRALAGRFAIFAWLPAPFRHRGAPVPLPADDVIGWEFEVFGYLLDQLGGYRHFRRRRLITPTDDELPVRDLEREGALPRLLARMKEIAGLPEWPCRIEFREDAETWPENPGLDRLFRVDRGSGEGVIELGRIGDASSTVAALAWGLGRFLIDSLGVDLPGGEDMRDAVAEICAVFLGFGLFTARGSAMAHAHGAEIDLHLCEILYAVGIFSALQNLQVKGFLRYLDGRSRAILRAVEEDVHRRWQPELDHLREQVPTHRL